MTKNILASFASFSSMLDERFSNSVYTTEDSIRYTLFLSLLKNNVCQHADIILELPHTAIKNAEIDAVISPPNSKESIAFEFKYDRQNPSQTNQNRTQRAGAVFKDIFRLAYIPPSTARRKLFVYITDSEMASYFDNPHNKLNTFFHLRKGHSYDITPSFISSKATTFQNSLKNLYKPCKVISQFSSQLSGNHFARIYEVETHP